MHISLLNQVEKLSNKFSVLIPIMILYKVNKLFLQSDSYYICES